MEIELKFAGIENILANLKRLEAVAREKALRRAMTRAFRPVLVAAQANAPRRSGALRLALAIVPKKGAALSAGKLAAGVVVTPRARNSRAVALYNLDYGRVGRSRIRGIFYGHMVEFGTRRGIQPRRFLYRALQANAQRVIDQFGVEIEKEIRKALR